MTPYQGYHSSREIVTNTYNPAYQTLSQYPHQSSTGRRELRAMERGSGSSQHRLSENGTAQNLSGNGHRNHRSSAASVSTAIHAPNSETSTGDGNSEDFNQRYNARRATTQSDNTLDRFAKTEMAPKSTEPSFNDDVTFSSRGIHIPTRTSSRCVPAEYC